MSKIQQVATQAALTSNYPRLIAFLQFWKWLGSYVRDFIHKNAPYQSYPNGKPGIFNVSAPPGKSALTIAVTADWGTGTLESETVAENMKGSSPDYTLHLGDVYYMGETGEIDENCLGMERGTFTGVLWPMGSLGSFALMGNHEMYSGGQAYFKTFLPRLGLFKAVGTLQEPQTASYFCIETEHWLLFGLDTGYHSGGVPFLTRIPGINSIGSLNLDARFDDVMLIWLKQTIQFLQAKGCGNKSVLLLTHHQPLSSFEHAFKKPAEQLAKLGFLNGRECVWLYGHEHRLTIYTKQTITKGLTVYPRCIGHGGMPVKVTRLSKPDPHIAFYDPREHPIDDKFPDTKVGYNGHALLILEGSRLTIEYHDILENNVLLTESFNPLPGGTLQHSYSRPANSGLLSSPRS